MGQGRFKFSWVGSEDMLLDTVLTTAHKSMVIGRYGGSTAAGAVKNEDGAYVLNEPEGSWEFVMLLDAHHTAESAELLVCALGSEEADIIRLLSLPVNEAFAALERFLLSIFKSEEFIRQCKEVTGETACLICARKENYVWWFSVGDNSLYLLHPDLAARGQYLLNQRNYYEWIGSVNIFDQPVACYSSGIRELRPGHNVIAMTTDGLLEYGERVLEDPRKLYLAFRNEEGLEKCVDDLLKGVHQGQGRDSATVVAWSYYNSRDAAMPSD
ncbi:protein phosphatase 2C domain-containing protein [Paenibacillus sp. MMS20-IR301]|uniref:protein phosphatase 2C domain-containing protein n=1 Tax=Paenibacillus sp. MMS20-IR301 TaxID=2895946 RepID=UPI0028F0A7B0|nr:protein phosphatase 2C domain-containing protein [Paenibacillus sp. MMS20-IR301]WNS40850.1 protein phosphatase 2C domain-containing protein [Paenibacillus sp. MMS20-IR301]